mgnify:CR=1 FL=1
MVGESYAVNWAVTVNPPGALGVALTGNVTVSDGTANCVAAVSAGTCNLTSDYGRSQVDHRRIRRVILTTPAVRRVRASPHGQQSQHDYDDHKRGDVEQHAPTVVGQSYAVNWSVTVNAPGSVGAALTGNVTVSDGAANCSAAVSVGTCNITSTTAGAKTITATYAGDTNYNGSASAGDPHTQSIRLTQLLRLPTPLH